MNTCIKCKKNFEDWTKDKRHPGVCMICVKLAMVTLDDFCKQITK